MGSQTKSVPSERRRHVERFLLRYAQEHPEDGQARAAEAAVREGLRVSPAGVRWIWKRHGLETAAKRAAALKKLGAARLSAGQKAALTRIAARRGGPTEDAPALAREHLLAVAVREFSRKGFARTSVRHIAQAAGIQPGSLYYHFPSKDELFVAAHTAGMREVGAAVQAAIAPLRDPWARLETACTVHLSHMVSGNDLTTWTGASLFLFPSAEMQRQLRAERDRFEALYRQLIEGLPLAAGVDRSLLRVQLLGSLNWTRTWYRPGKKTPAQIARHLVGALRRGVERR